MSSHGNDTPELSAALEKHGLPSDRPSQLADAFRLGWDARHTGRRINKPCKKCGWPNHGEKSKCNRCQTPSTLEAVV